ncbi:hypothetical protein AMK30_31845 [Streptomyces sp. CB02460]|nr:hypothetical protein AMK30_31845 [Streptomyces sp. CB02460]
MPLLAAARWPAAMFGPPAAEAFSAGQATIIRLVETVAERIRHLQRRVLICPRSAASAQGGRGAAQSATPPVHDFLHGWDDLLRFAVRELQRIDVESTTPAEVRSLAGAARAGQLA